MDGFECLTLTDIALFDLAMFALIAHNFRPDHANFEAVVRYYS